MGIGYNVAVCVYDDSRAHRVLPYDQRGLRKVFLVRGNGALEGLAAKVSSGVVQILVTGYGPAAPKHPGPERRIHLCLESPSSPVTGSSRPGWYSHSRLLDGALIVPLRRLLR
jgi:hypothetical protein